MKVRIPKNQGLARFFLAPWGRILIAAFALFIIAGLSVFTYFYAKYSSVIDHRLNAGLLANSAKIFAAPESVAVSDVATPAEIAVKLRRSGYTESRGNAIGSYQLQPNSIEIYPGPDSYFDQEAGVIKFA
ncbi:MAG TPA: penicillin-binding protein 1A, partial [Bryobacteraceae bacterium]